jgi:alanine-glyoxylate transaminase/serine-glyoxylate transaminase/serine-pyruvate transaminase
LPAIAVWPRASAAASPPGGSTWWPSTLRFYSDTVSAIRPQGVDAREVMRIAYADLQHLLRLGPRPLAGKVFRIGHLGDLNEGMALTALSHGGNGAGTVPGAQIQLGAGVAAAQRLVHGMRG